MDYEISDERPRELNTSNVQFWSKHTKELTGSQVRKALQFLDHDCLQYVGDDDEFDSKYTFICLPLNTDSDHDEVLRDQVVTFHKKPFIKDYNNSMYKIYKNDSENFECNCQGWQTKAKRGEIIQDGANCSHVLALYYAFKIGKFNKQHGARDKDLIIERTQVIHR